MTSANKQEILLKTFAPYGLPSGDELDRISELFKIRELKKGEILVREGDTSTTCAFIIKGLVRFYLHTFEGKEFIITLKSEGDFIMSYYPVMTGKPSPFNIEALEDCTLLAADYKQVEKLFLNSPHLGKIAAEFYKENFIYKADRELSLLMYDAKERYLRFVEENPDIAKRISQKHLAMYLGINPVSLNRIVKSL